MPSRSLRLLVLVLVAVAVPAAWCPAPTAAQAPDDAGLPIVRAVYDNLLDLFVRPAEPAALLTAGWDSLAQSERRAGRPAPAPLGPLPADRAQAFEAFAARYRAVAGVLSAGREPHDVAFTIATGMAASLREQHTGFLPPASYASVVAATGSGGGGVGAGINLASRLPAIVAEVAPNGPASRAGVNVGDEIVAIDGREPRGGGQISAALNSGAEGSVVRIGINRAGTRLDLTVTRGPFTFPTLESRLLPGGAGYLRLRGFVLAGTRLPDGTELLADIDRRLDDLDARGATGLILDLRGNPGGAVVSAAELLGRFLPEDTLTARQFDGRGRSVTGIVSGQMRRDQLPMVVLVDGASGSAAEYTAATLREAGRAVLVGQRTSGSLSFAQILPLPEGAGLIIAFAEVVTARNGFKIDGVGAPVDVTVSDSRTAADYRTGRDPQLEAAITALAGAPAPPAFDSTPTAFSAARLRAMLGPYLPAPARIPTDSRLTTVQQTAARALNHPNQNFVVGARDPVALQETNRRRGWLGSLSQSYGAGPLARPSIAVSIDLYATAAGAAEAVAANDQPDYQQPLPSPPQLGEQSAAYEGVWGALGASALVWRRGQMVVSVAYADTLGAPPSDIPLAVARMVDGDLARRPPQPAALYALPRVGSFIEADAESAVARGAAPVIAALVLGAAAIRIRRSRSIIAA